MGMFEGKKGIIMGVANGYSIASGIAEFLHQEGAELGFSYLPDETGKMLTRVKKVVDAFEPKMIESCNVRNDSDIEDFFKTAKEKMGHIDFVVHSIAYSPTEDIKCPSIEASREGFLTAMDISVYSFMKVAKESASLMSDGGSIIGLSYYGGERVIPGYNMMGICKSALEMAIRYAAFDLGPANIRVNGISAGPIKTLSSSAIGDFSSTLGMNEAIAPTGRNVTKEDVARSALYLLSELASGTTGEILHVDGGYHIMGSPGRAFEKWGINPNGKARK